MKTLSIAKIFKSEFGIDWKEMKEFEAINVEKFGKKIRSFNPKTKKEEFNLIKNIIRKPNSKAYMVKCNGKEFECSADHKVAIKFDKDLPDFTYMTVSQLKKTGNYFMYNDGNWEAATVKSLDKEIPILDIEVENTHNYFANGILSHNTVYGSPECQPGGQALKFMAHIRCEIRKGEKNEGEEDEDVIGIKAKIKNVKNKTSVPFRKGEIFISFKNGIDVYGEYLDFSVSMGIIQKGGAWYTIDGERAQGRENAIELLRKNETIFNNIKNKVDSQLSGNPIKDLDLPYSEEKEIKSDTQTLADIALNK